MVRVVQECFSYAGLEMLNECHGRLFVAVQEIGGNNFIRRIAVGVFRVVLVPPAVHL